MTDIRRYGSWAITVSVFSFGIAPSALVATATLVGMLGCLGLPAVVSADPIRIVDTGPSGPVATRSVDWNTQWVAAEFSTSNAWRIVGVEGWMVPSGLERFAGRVRINLLSDGGSIPSTPVFTTSTNIPGVGAAGWYGQSGLSWTIQPGSFWISFEALAHTDSGPAFSGATFGMSATTLAPLANQAAAGLVSDCNFRDRACWPWTPDSGMDLGVRIFAEAVPEPVPEPATVVLIATGIIGAGLRRGLLSTGTILSARLRSRTGSR